jgi:hypothetical protein
MTQRPIDQVEASLRELIAQANGVQGDMRRTIRDAHIELNESLRAEAERITHDLNVAVGKCGRQAELAKLVIDQEMTQARSQIMEMLGCESPEELARRIVAHAARNLRREAIVEAIQLMPDKDRKKLIAEAIAESPALAGKVNIAHKIPNAFLGKDVRAAPFTLRDLI